VYFAILHAMPPFFRQLQIPICVVLLTLACGSKAAATDIPNAPGGFTEAQLAVARALVRQEAPDCPTEVVDAVSGQFLDDLQTNHPSAFDQLLAPDFPAKQFETSLIRDVGSHLSGPQWDALKEQLATHRIQAIIASGEGPSGVPASEAPGIMARIKATPDPLYFQRLVNGKIEDDDLVVLIKKNLSEGEQPKKPEAVQAKVLTAEDIVAEFGRRNQEGDSVASLRAFVIDGTLETGDSGPVEVILFKLRPDYFRMVVLKDGLTQSIVAGHAGKYWRQKPGTPPEPVRPEAAADLQRLGEFLDPLFAEEGYTFERLPDSTDGPVHLYRVAVRRIDGSRYVARIDPSTFHEVGRETGAGADSTRSDFRQVAGITLAFREDSTNAHGVKSVFRINRFTPNPGLVGVLFDPPPAEDQGYFDIERLLARSVSVPAGGTR
jgi:hypothetical protein